MHSWEPPEVCEIEGCGGVVCYVVTKSDQTRYVCRHCLEEMTALYGWTLLPAAIGIHRRSTAEEHAARHQA